MILLLLPKMISLEWKPLQSWNRPILKPNCVFKCSVMFIDVIMYGTAGETPEQEQKRKKIEDSGYGSGSRMANAILEVECQKLHVHKEVRVS